MSPAVAPIHVRDLAVRYGERVVLAGVSFDLAAGEFGAVVGASGCGKSSLLHAIAGFIAHEGEVSASTNIGVVFQEYAVFPWLTARENIAAGLSHMPRAARARVVEDHLHLADLSREGDRYPAQLSGGQRQRVALARALAPNPMVVLMDEPFGALDSFTRDRMQVWLLRIWEMEKKTILFVTHNLEEALFLADRVLVLGGCRIQCDYRVPFDRPRPNELRYTMPFAAAKRELLELLEGTGGNAGQETR